MGDRVLTGKIEQAMDIDQQIQQLIEQAPQYGTSVDQVQLVAPVLKQLAARLRHLQYYILQNLQQNWLTTTLQHRTQLELTKQVVYAYPSLEAVKAGMATQDPQLLALPLPTVQILFQLLALTPIDSIIFFEGDLPQSGVEISRQGLLQALEQHVRSQQRLNLPKDIA